ncbi:MAG: 1-hydroxycarotenoid 3,4-desaturase CrtD [Pseudomonadota bacterium]
MEERPIVIIGSGIAGLSAALTLAAQHRQVIVLDRGDAPGGKMRTIEVNGQAIDSGPTVLTMRSVFDELLDDVGFSLDELVPTVPLDCLARHAWNESERLDLYAERNRSIDAIGDFAGSAEADAYRRFCQAAGRTYETLEYSFLRASKPNPLSLSWRARSKGPAAMLGIKPFSSFWQVLTSYFRDPRLIQLFGRYATYCGCSPWQAPATLMLIAHLEQEGVWRVRGGMQRLADGLMLAARQRGVMFRFGEEVVDIATRGGSVSTVMLRNRERIECDSIICTADPSALNQGLLGSIAATSIKRPKPRQRSLSAITWSMTGRPSGFDLAYHNVFFSSDYAKEFQQLFAGQTVPSQPTVYLCAQDQGEDPPAEGDPQRLFCLINAPAIGDKHTFNQQEIASCTQRTMRMLASCNLQIETSPEHMQVTTPSDFAKRFPGSAGALYGKATHGWRSAFQRPSARTRLSGLYLAGGGVHPGPGVPMVALSGRLAAHALLQDQASTRRLVPAATVGGMSTP